ncbi:hypothetical protein HCN44_007786 [Aphidius gifuensis]|uniref:Uncharacterized protein n=1 Tax=Aphidius gifuensis TaxID=684658 RepID=A0A834XMZ8_APHGI|nr:hypothetical protein HCN44_007786 [Aphidius gifuensis]
MVAELNCIPSITVKKKGQKNNKNSVSFDNIDNNIIKTVKRPSWIEIAIRESIPKFINEDNEPKKLTNYQNFVKKKININNVIDEECSIKSDNVNINIEETFIDYKEPIYSVVDFSKKSRDKKIGDNNNADYLIHQKELLEKNKQLSEWLENSKASINNRDFIFIEKNNFIKKMKNKESSDDPWLNPVSIPRGVINIENQNRYRKIFKDENHDIMMEKNDDITDDMMSTNVDSISEFGTLSYQKHSKINYDIQKNIPSIEHDDNWKFVAKKIHENQQNDSLKFGIEKIMENSHIDGTNESTSNIDDDNTLPKYSVNNTGANNESHDKDSLNETGSNTEDLVEGNQSGSAHNRRSGKPTSANILSSDLPENRPNTTTASPRSLVSRILAGARSPDNDLLDNSEPYSQLWIVLSNVYGELIIIMMMALCLAEVMDTPVPLLSVQSFFLIYLYVGSIIVIISIYLWVLMDSCGSLSGNSDDAELGGTSLTRFGSLKRAHISRSKTASTSFYIRVGALLFGLATLVFNGIEMAMYSLMQGADCLSDIVFVHPVLHGLFTFLQMHFLFVNSQVLVEKFGLAARFGFTHLAATNIAVWVRLVIWDSAQEWTYFVHLAQKGPEISSSPLSLRRFPSVLNRKTRDIIDGNTAFGNSFTAKSFYQPISDEQISQVVTLQQCLNTNTLGQLWTSSMLFLYPFIVQFSLIAAAVTFVMGQNVGRNRFSHKHKFHSIKDLTSHTRIGCDSSSKGLFLGILSMTAGIVVILIFLVVRENEKFPPTTLSWLTNGTLIAILGLSSLMTISGLVQVRQMSIVSRAPPSLDTILSNITIFGVQLYCIFTAVVCACSLISYSTNVNDEIDDDSRGRHIMLLIASILQLFQCFAQSTLIAEASKRSCITRYQMIAKPARQVITFLLFSNAVLWAFDTVVTQTWITQELQLRFFGVLAWGIISRICLPLLIFYRFHSCVLLLEAWNKCYRTPRGELSLN